jgi:hypothetical protein
MASTFTTALRLVKQGLFENNTTWGTIFNQQFADLIDTAIAGYTNIVIADTNKTLTAANGATDEARSMMLNFTGSLSAVRSVIVPTTSKLYFVRNSTTGGFAVIVKTAAGTGVSVPSGGKIAVACDGANVVDLITALDTSSTVGGNTIGYRDVVRRTSGWARGECTSVSTSQTLNTSDMGAGYSFSLYNDSEFAITITQGIGVTLRLAGTTTAGNLALAPRGMATIWCNSATEAVAIGAGLY